jgi:Type I phosphodiesterase / nucleotide pyrophosphatase
MKPYRGWGRASAGLAAMSLVGGLTLSATAQAGANAAATTATATPSGCQLSTNGRIQHVIQIQFDNTHFTRDNPNVPSDLEQMPNLLNFIEGNGVLMANHHTPLIAHTATDILTTETGVYPDRHGVAVSNSFRVFDPTSSSGSDFASSFGYWTDPVTTSADTTPLMMDQGKDVAPAPWVPFTRAGCNVGGVATANAEIENVKADIPVVFGPNSPEAQQLASDPNPFKDQEVADYEGIAIHCGAGSAMCVNAPAGTRAVADVLPSEPGGYNGFQALYGHKYVTPVINPGSPLRDLDGKIIKEPFINKPGFPGFDITASQALSYVAAMQEHGVAVTYAYIRDAHQNFATGNAAGPGSPVYVQNLRQQDADFGKFFARLASDGITAANTLFVVTADEGDHFAGVQKTGCDGVTVACHYGNGQIGELNTNIQGLLATEKANTTPFQIHSDSAPNFYLAGNPARTDPTLRQLERDVAGLTGPDPYLGKTPVPLTNFLADPVEAKILHMQTADPQRNPNFTAFLKPDYFAFPGGTTCPPTPPSGQFPTGNPCITVNPAFAWNHGDVAPEINTTWLGLVGPGVRARGVDSTTWSDHVDIRPTILALLGLKDDYPSDGRVLTEELRTPAVPPAIQGSPSFQRLAAMYKQINASVGQFALDTLAASTTGMASGSSGDDEQYNQREEALAGLGRTRDAVAGQMIRLLNGAAFDNTPFTSSQAGALIQQGQSLLEQAEALAGH